MTLSQIKTYTIGVLKLWFGNKSTLDKISESENGNIVYNGKEIIDNSEQVKGLTTKVDGIKRYSKYINAELDSCFMKLPEDYTPVEGEYLPFQKVSGSLEVNNGRVIVQPNQRVHLSLSLSYSDSTNEVFPDISYSFKDYTNNTVINAIPEFDFINFCQYTNNTNTICEIGICVEKISTNDVLNNMTTLTIHEITKVVIDPLDYVNAEQGIEDTPVGHLMDTVGDETPQHYLLCDGTEYPIADYPYLVQHFEEQFGVANYYGGDGITTFAVPNLLKNIITEFSPEMTSANTPSPYVVSSLDYYTADSNIYYGYYAFDNNVNTFWHSGSILEENWLLFDAGKRMKITGFKMTPRINFPTQAPIAITLQGSNDGEHFEEIITFSNISWTDNSEKEFNCPTIVTYRFYRFYFTEGSAYSTKEAIAISNIKFLVDESETIKNIKYEPTYYMTVVQNINTDPELQQIIAQLSLILDDINVEVV